MTPEKAEALKAHAEAIAAILYEEADPEQWCWIIIVPISMALITI